MSGRGRVRITGGLWRGRAVMVPAGIRPPGSRVREALGSIWSARLPGASVLDLFAGSGTLGLEALSRGARFAWFVEQHRPTARLIRQNLDQFDLKYFKIQLTETDYFKQLVMSMRIKI